MRGKDGFKFMGGDHVEPPIHFTSDRFDEITLTEMLAWINTNMRVKKLSVEVNHEVQVSLAQHSADIATVPGRVQLNIGHPDDCGCDTWPVGLNE